MTAEYDAFIRARAQARLLWQDYLVHLGRCNPTTCTARTAILARSRAADVRMVALSERQARDDVDMADSTAAGSDCRLRGVAWA